MGIVGVLVTIIILIIVLVFSNSFVLPLNKPEVKPSNIEESAQSAVDKTLENYKLEQEQTKKLE